MRQEVSDKTVFDRCSILFQPLPDPAMAAQYNTSKVHFCHHETSRRLLPRLRPRRFALNRLRMCCQPALPKQ
ncbi:hypothetical protein L596_008711 [Steinernema carpocapsae]|uniref:Uncharacterized protein n=1 Tax=Steinernema carpocapsae TaxID=34508 RepID=A0A4U5PDE6_STECR|nr:hypothetical protein L596_008711 [Steinernema carpocapsae]